MQANICGRQNEEEASSLLICDHDETPGSKSEPRLGIYCLKARSLACVLLLISRAWLWLNSELVSYRLAPCNKNLYGPMYRKQAHSRKSGGRGGRIPPVEEMMWNEGCEIRYETGMELSVQQCQKSKNKHSRFTSSCRAGHT